MKEISQEQCGGVCVDSALADMRVLTPWTHEQVCLKTSKELGHSQISKFEVVARKESCKLEAEDVRVDESSDSLNIITSPSMSRRVVPVQIIECPPNRVSPEKRTNKPRLSTCVGTTCRAFEPDSESFRLPHFTAATPYTSKCCSRNDECAKESQIEGSDLSYLQAVTNYPGKFSQMKQRGELFAPCLYKFDTTKKGPSTRYETPSGASSILYAEDNSQQCSALEEVKSSLPAKIGFCRTVPFASKPRIPMRTNVAAKAMKPCSKRSLESRRTYTSGGDAIAERISRNHVASFLPKTLSMLTPPGSYCLENFREAAMGTIPLDRSLPSFPLQNLEMPCVFGPRSTSTGNNSIEEARVSLGPWSLQASTVPSPKHRLDEDEMTNIVVPKKSPRYETPVSSESLWSQANGEADGFATPTEQMWPHLKTPPVLQSVSS